MLHFGVRRVLRGMSPDPAPPDTPFVVRRCEEGDWPEVRRLHIKLALAIPLVVDVDLNEVLATPSIYWKNFVRACAAASDQALFVAHDPDGCVGMGHVGRPDTQARLSMLYVEVRARRRGIGSALVRVQEAWAHAAGATELAAHIPVTSPALLLAEELGWHRTETTFSTHHGLIEQKWIRSEA